MVVPGDITVEKDVAAVVEKTAKHFGKIDILVNNAGMAMMATIDSATTEEYNRVWETNFRGPLCMLKTALPYLRKTKGNIVNVSSVASTIVAKGSTHYCMTKAALDHLTRCAALENAPFGVRVNSVNPGVIKTALALQPGTNKDEFLEVLEKMTAAVHALGRIGTPEEVARCIAFLASDNASFVTGITMPVDGGLLLMSSLSHGTPWDEKK